MIELHNYYDNGESHMLIMIRTSLFITHIFNPEAYDTVIHAIEEESVDVNIQINHDYILKK
jgi:hypothetical protein